MTTVERPGFAAFNAADYLRNEGMFAEYLAVAAADPDPAVYRMALVDVAKARISHAAP